MVKSITIEELRVGMRIEKLDIGWLASPLLSHRMTVTSADQIDRLKRSGVQTVDILVKEDDRSPDELSASMSEAQPVSGHPASVPFEEEMPVARHIYQAAKTIIEGAMHDIRLGRAINVDAVNQVVSQMADSVLRRPDALTSLSRIKNYDEYTFYHSVNTSLLALALGRHLNFDRQALHHLGVGTLLHDIGKTKIPLEVLNKPGRFAPHEQELMKQHVLRGAEILAKTQGLEHSHFTPTLEHHERVDGTGYPFQRHRGELSSFGLIAAIVDIYDAITSDRCYHKAKPAHEAVQYLYRLGQQGHLEEALVRQFIEVVGVYPVGSLVHLNTGEVAIVQRVSPGAPLVPVVLIIKNADQVVLRQAEACDLANPTCQPLRQITGVYQGAGDALEAAHYLDGV